MIKIAAILAFTLSFAFGDELPNDVKRLQTQRDQAVKKIDAKFISQLEQLKKKHMNRGDLKAANAIQELIAGIAPQEDTDKLEDHSKTSQPTKTELEDSLWTWGSGGTLTLQKNGVARHTSWGHSAGKWKKYSDGSIKISVGQKVFKVTFLDDMQGQVTLVETGAKTTITRKN
ncbi:hypothetical protein OAK89_03010 [Akkermansiaceae bacterium]|nr:hypothetical protein [Akkermansiaceae bacterium]MDB4820478.1 hypothetical protein [Akkermansiaceae bacterium]MDC0287173.1 hypothetical protein [Akkermansiaceae bacterium]